MRHKEKVFGLTFIGVHLRLPSMDKIRKIGIKNIYHMFSL